MIKITDVSVPLNYSDEFLKHVIRKRLEIKGDEILSIKVIKKSVDARRKSDVHFILTLEVELYDEAKILDSFSNDRAISKSNQHIYNVTKREAFKNSPVVVGLGPAGLFAGLILAEAGVKPIILERGEDVDSRKKSVDNFWKTGNLNTESNVQFGEGGAGTFSDGKLTTGSKDIRLRHILEKFVEFGAPQEILYNSKPHIGTDKLSSIVKEMRNRIIELGGTVIFNAKFCDFIAENNQITSISYEKHNQIYSIETNHIILAIGHSARDIFELLYEKNIKMSQKNFAVGVRIEHLQRDINRSMYGAFAEHPALGAADYKLAIHLPDGRSVYTFCMCPGGQVVASASEKDMLVTNGMSNFRRDGKNANSALLVGISPEDFSSDNPLAGIEFQRDLERKAFIAGGGNYSAPITLVGDFLKNRVSNKIGKVKPTYKPSIKFAQPEEYLPDFVCKALRLSIPQMGRKIRGFDNPDAVITGIESRSSSPVRIDRDETMQSLSLKGLYPCGEGAGYAGGIISAGVDGIRCAESILSE